MKPIQAFCIESVILNPIFFTDGVSFWIVEGTITKGSIFTIREVIL